MRTTPPTTLPPTTRQPTTARPMSRLRRCRPVSRSCGRPACPPHPPPPGARMPPARVAGTSSSGDARAPGGLPRSPTRRAAPGRALSRRRKLLLRAQRRTPAWLCSPRSRCLSQRPTTPPALLLPRPLRRSRLSGRPPLPTARRSGGDARRRQRGRSSSPRGTGPTGRARMTRPAPPARGVSASPLTRRCPRCRGPTPLPPPPTTPPQQRRRWRWPPPRRSCRQRRPSPPSQRWRLALRGRERAAAAPAQTAAGPP
mmetsp:Transcript_7852/g.25759  ORF Transcript_7852/g.25759 Transcript_7852/m.25759 type:complete len:256 (+) Transcript_7852:510-1277(+)